MFRMRPRSRNAHSPVRPDCQDNNFRFRVVDSDLTRRRSRSRTAPLAAATAQDLDGTGAAESERPNARQDGFSNTRQAENSNTRQPVQVIDSIEGDPVSSNARQRADGYLDNGPVSNTRPSVDGHMNRSAANTRQTLDAGAAFNYEAQLFRLETYKDKYGRTICKRVVRFLRNRTGRNIGEVTPELSAALSRRPGKGRTTEARAEAERNRLLAESLAKRLRRAKASGRRASARKGRSGQQARRHPDAFGSELLSDVSDFPRDNSAAYVH